MITTVCLNPALDKTYTLQKLAPGNVHRIESVHTEPGGKGINVAKVIHALHTPILAVGFSGGAAGRTLQQQLNARGIDHRMVSTAGETRCCLNLLEAGNRQTELLEPGPHVTASDFERLQQLLDSLALPNSWFVFSGSLPKGAAPETYQKLITRIQQKGAHAVVDVSGAPLKHAIAAVPYAVKMNEEELLDWWSCPVSPEKYPDILCRLNHQGIPLAIVTLGESGAWAACRNTVYRVCPPVIPAVNPVGSGDAFTAGLTVSLQRQEPVEQALRLATACACSNACAPVAGFIQRSEVEGWVSKVRVVIRSKSGKDE
jgi:tagatose 6-phosphate kinase